MTDYWKSQERKYCEFCKCWITDNKPSIQFHENGKRHKENVAKKISELTKKSTKAQKESKKISEEMKKMEEAAMKAYMKDMELNPDFTSLQHKKEEEKSIAEKEEKSIVEKEEIKEMVKQVCERNKEVNIIKKWYEAKSEEGHTYYWNIETKESAWEAPKDYLSLEEQKKSAEIEARKNTLLQETMQKEANEEMRARTAREEMKKKFKKFEEKKIEELPGPILGPAPKVDPYGSWKTVEKKIERPIDWQLPKVKHIPQVIVPTELESKITKIKEKKINSLGDEASEIPTIFKKRKPNCNRGHIRQRSEDE